MKKIFFNIFLFIFINTYSQENSIINNILYDYHNALNLFKYEDYSNSYVFFEKLINTNYSSHFADIENYKNESKFYSTLIAIKLGKMPVNDDIINVFNKELNKSKKELASTFMGNYFFEKGDYLKSMEWFNNINKDKNYLISNQNICFNIGYSNFRLGNNEQAKTNLEILANIESSKYYEKSNYLCGLIAFNEKKFNESKTYFSKIQKSEDEKLDIGFILGQIYFLEKDYNKVIQLNENNIDNNENKIERFKMLGKSYFEIKRYDKALKYLSEYVRLSEKVDAEEMYQLAFCEYRNKMYDLAIEHFKELQINEVPFQQYAMYALADCYLKNGEKNNARLAFVSALSISKDEVITEESLFNIAKLNYELNNFSEAITTLNDFIKKYPNSNHIEESWDLLTNSVLASNNYSLAIELIESNPKLQNGKEKIYQTLCYAYSVHLFKNNDFAKSKEYLKKAIVNDYDKNIFAESLMLFTEIIYKEENYSEANDLYNTLLQKVLKENQLYNKTANLFRIYYSLAYIKYINKEYQTALEFFINSQENIPLKPDNKELEIKQDVDLRVADLYFLQKKYDLAYENYLKIIKNNQKGSDYAILQKATIDGVLKNNDKKIESLNSLITNNPKSIYIDDALYLIGQTYEENKNNKLAVEIYSKIVKEKPNTIYAPKALLRIANIYLNNNNLEESFLYNERVLNEYPNSPESEQAINGIKEIYTLQDKLEEYLEYLNKLPNSKQLSISTQDSMLFEAGEDYFANKNCEKAISYFNKYINKFPEGNFYYKALYYKAECFFNSKNYDEAMENYTLITQNNKNPFYENASIRMINLMMNKKNYSSALELLIKIKDNLTSTKNAQFVAINLVKCFFEEKEYKNCILQTETVQYDKDIHLNYKNDAIYYKIKSLFLLEDYTNVLINAKDFTKDKNSIRSAECAYLLAKSYTNLKEYKASNEFLQKAKEDYAIYEYWIIKMYIQMAINYNYLSNNYQAKATLQSILNNYKEKNELTDEVNSLMKKIEEELKSSSKIKN